MNANNNARAVLRLVCSLEGWRLSLGIAKTKARPRGRSSLVEFAISNWLEPVLDCRRRFLISMFKKPGASLQVDLRSYRTFSENSVRYPALSSWVLLMMRRPGSGGSPGKLRRRSP
jgi:hypothetical protein